MMKRWMTSLLGTVVILASTLLAGRIALTQSAAPSIVDVDQATLIELALSYQILVNEGVLDAYGHVSIRLCVPKTSSALIS